MSDSASRYRAILEIVACCSSSYDVGGALQNILSAAESALPTVSLELLLASGDSHTRICSRADASHDAVRTAPTGVPDSFLREILACICPSLIEFSRNGSSAVAWVVPLEGSLLGTGALVCEHDGLQDADREFLQTVARYFSLYLESRWMPSGGDRASADVEKRIKEISAVYEISQAVHSMAIGDLLWLVTKTAALVMDAEACSLMLKDPNRDELVIQASYGLSEKIVEETRVPYGEGVAGQVAQTGEPMLINDLGDDPRFAKARIRPRPGIVSSICVPLADEERRVRGVLSVRRATPAKPFNEDDVKLFSVFASQAALAISNAQLYSSLKDRVQELSTLYEASRELSGAYTIEKTAEALIRVAAEMVADVPSLLLLLDSRQKARAQASAGVPDEMKRRVTSLIGDAAVVWARGLREPRTLVVANQSRWPAPIRPIAKVVKDAFTRLVLVPLVAEDSLVGMLILGIKDKKPPDQQRVRLLSIAASQAGTIIKNAMQHEKQMEQKALELTALYELSERISTARSLNEALDSILDIVRDIVWYDESFIATADYERSMLTVQACRGAGLADLQDTEISLDEDSLTNWAIHERKALVSPDISLDTRLPQPIRRGGAVRSLMAIPLIVHDEVVGVLNVHAYAPNLYTEENVRVLSVIASQAAALYKELEALSALANYTDNILRSIAAGVLTLDREGRVLTWNKAAEEIISIPADEAVNQHFSELVDRMGIAASDKERILTAISQVMGTGESYLGYKQEYHPISKGTLHINMSISQLRDHLGGMLGLVIIFEDVTNEVRMENEMRRISELAAVGQLAASIAHELRNPLSSIKGAAQYLIKEYADHVAVCEFLGIIIEEVNVLNKITTDFLDFARPTRLNLKEIDINDVIFRTVQFMHLDIAKHKVEVEQNLAYDAPRIQADDRLLEQVLRNIVLNSLQAMPKGGRLAVTSEPARDGVKLVVSDTGVGMSEETISQIFVPFFTTRTKGTGLGLSIVQKIVDNHGGKISVRSVVGAGTTFEVSLPVCSERAQSVIMQENAIPESVEADLFRRGSLSP